MKTQCQEREEARLRRFRESQFIDSMRSSVAVKTPTPERGLGAEEWALSHGFPHRSVP